MKTYHFQTIEKKWQKKWRENKTYKVSENPEKPKYYVLDMFPYPSGAGLHVGHPLGYIASDIYARYKKLKGFNVLHPMGYDAFGLPAEQYAIQTGQHPALTTEKNIARYREQLDKIGFSFDWEREVRTCDPDYYRWTQWIFKLFFNSYYNKNLDKAEPIEKLIQNLEKDQDFQILSEKEKTEYINQHRLAYLKETWVNWCPALGTVLANDEVIQGRSERGGHPVEQKKMLQWNLGMAHYAERLLQDLEKLDWSEAIKEQQRHWIGKSTGANINFFTENKQKLTIFTTRPDTLYGVTFITLAVEKYEEYFTETSEEIKNFVQKIKNIPEIEKNKMKEPEGIFTGQYAIHPLTNEKIPIYLGSYVLGNYGTGVVMGCPAGDQRDFNFAKKYQIKIKEIFNFPTQEKAYEEKDAVLKNSALWENLEVPQAIQKALKIIEEKKIGQAKTTYRLRDAGFSRQRYWGEPFPVFFKENQPFLTPENHPIHLPNIEEYLPTSEGNPPLARAKNWVFTDPNTGEKHPLECNTMPGWAGSSWYFLRYLDPKNQTAFVGEKPLQYWKNVDLYIGGSEHATGHLLYARFWTKFLYDLGKIPFDEPFQKLINQGMILGRSSIIYRIDYMTVKFLNNEEPVGEQLDHYPIFISKNKKEELEKLEGQKKQEAIWKLQQQIKELHADKSWTAKFMSFSPIHVSIDLVQNDILDIEKYKKWEFAEKNASFICEDNRDFICDFEIEKMSKSKHNVQTPDELVEKFGADTLRCFEMFLGPLEQFKPWDVQGISGTHNFLKKFWRLFYNESQFLVNKNKCSEKSMQILHKTIKKVSEDLERFSFNTVVSSLMIAVNELTEEKCHNQEILEPLLILLSPYAPHICEELWADLGNEQSITEAKFPIFEEKYLISAFFEYPVSIDGKTKYKLNLSSQAENEELIELVKASAEVKKYLENKEISRIIAVKGKIINIVTKK